MQYAQDYDERMPFSSGGYDYVSEKWWNMIYPYIKNQQVYACPSSGYSAPFVTYCYNYNIGIFGIYGGGVTLAQIEYPAQTIVINERNDPWPRRLGSTSLDCWAMREWPATDPYYWNEWTTPHNKGCNLALADGHAKWYSMIGRLKDTGYVEPPYGTSFKIPGLYIKPDGSD